VPALAWATTYAPLQQYGLKVRLVDIDPGTLNVSLPALGAASGGAAGFVAVDVLGNPNDFGRVRAVSGAPLLLEDCCESMGAAWAGRSAGTFARIGTFSMFRSHHICTMEGGIAVTDDADLADLMRCLRAHGWTRDIRPEPMDFEDRFRFVVPGYNVRPLEIQAAAGLVQLDKLDGFIAERRANADKLAAVLPPWLAMQTETPGGQSSWMGFALTITDGRPRAGVLQALAARGIETRPVIAGNFARHTASLYFDMESGELPNTDMVHDHGFMVGNAGRPLDREIASFAEALS
jgi:CDP-6-deoxy-D-xylo-4-hexulose-3-dehydrase